MRKVGNILEKLSKQMKNDAPMSILEGTIQHLSGTEYSIRVRPGDLQRYDNDKNEWITVSSISNNVYYISPEMIRSLERQLQMAKEKMSEFYLVTLQRIAPDMVLDALAGDRREPREVFNVTMQRKFNSFVERQYKLCADANIACEHIIEFKLPNLPVTGLRLYSHSALWDGPIVRLYYHYDKVTLAIKRWVESLDYIKRNMEGI